MKLSGIYGEEEKECGCKIKHYGLGGLRILIGCKNKDHKDESYYVCGVCDKEFKGKGAKKNSKDHQWEHTS